MWGNDWLCDVSCQEVSRCSARGGSEGIMYITFASTKKLNKAELTLALKPRGDVTRQLRIEIHFVFFTL